MHIAQNFPVLQSKIVQIQVSSSIDLQPQLTPVVSVATLVEHQPLWQLHRNVLPVASSNPFLAKTNLQASIPQDSSQLQHSDNIVNIQMPHMQTNLIS